MQIILTEDEYNKLLQRAGQVEAQVEVRLEEEKKLFFAKVKRQIQEQGIRTPQEMVRVVIDLLHHYE